MSARIISFKHPGVSIARSDRKPGLVLILPVVRIERDDETPGGDRRRHMRGSSNQDAGATNPEMAASNPSPAPPSGEG